MKHFIFSCACLCIAIISLSGCKGNTYANGLKTEKQIIADFIEREHINILDEMPADDAVWGEKDFVRMDGYGYDYMYFHLSKRGDIAGDSVEIGDIVNLRYKKYSLGITSDTISLWTTNDSSEPLTFGYGIDYETACTAWHAAIKYMKYSNSEATIICPSKLGFNDDTQNITPYGYDLKMQIKKY